MVAQTKSIGYHFLYASTIYVEKFPTEIQTVLGSCVSVCLFDQRQRFGGINHYMLPLWNGDGLATAKYGNIAIEKLLQKMLSLQADQRDIVAKVFGGAEQMKDSALYSIGKRNIQVAYDTLSTLRIPIISSNTGGPLGRKLLFDSGSGNVYMRLINTQNRNSNETS